MSANNKSAGDNSRLRSGSRIPINKQNHLETEVETVSPTTPLMGDKNPSLATPEVDEADDREVVTKPNPGVDDGFYNNGNSNTDVNSEAPPPTKRNNPNSEVPERTPVDTNDVKHNPENTENHRDENDGTRPDSRRPSVSYPHFPRESDFGVHNHHHDFDVGSGVIQEIPDINVYQHKKTLAQGMMDLALFSANANQLRYVIDSYDRHPYYYPSMICICFSLLLQIVIGVGLIWNATYNVKDEKEVCRANKINNYTVMGIFLVTVVNVFVSAFGVADPATPAVVTNST